MSTDRYYEGLNLRLAQLVPEGATRILEVGCGAGGLGAYLRERVAGRQVFGLEIVEAVARRAQDRLDGVVVGDIEAMEDLPFDEGFFDCITFGDVLEHLREPEAVLARLRRYLAPGGQIVCCVPNVAHWSVVAELLQGRFTYADNGLLDRTHLRFFTPQSFHELLDRSGYTVEVQEEILAEHAASEVLAEASARLGIQPEVTRRALNTYQMLFRARAAAPLPLASTTVVVVTYNSSATIERCLDSVFAADPCQVVVVDNCSSDGTPRVLADLAGRNDNLVVIPNGENLGFSAACNQGIDAGSGEMIVLLNPDTVVTPGWLRRMQSHLTAGAADAPVGAVGPTSDYVAGLQQVRLYLPGWESLAADPAALDSALARNHAGRSVPTKLLIGFCLMVPRRVLDEVGYLDAELFLGNDDLDLSWRLRLAGYQLRVATDVFVHHVGQVSFRTEPAETTKRLVQESTDALARKLRRHYGPGQVPTSEDLWGMSWFTPSFDLWAVPTVFFAALDAQNNVAAADVIRCYTEAFPSDAPVSLVLGVDESSGLGLEHGLSMVQDILEGLGRNLDDIPDIALQPCRGWPDETGRRAAATVWFSNAGLDSGDLEALSEVSVARLRAIAVGRS